MNFNAADLVTARPESKVLVKQAFFRLPFTPFFIAPSNSADLRCISFQGYDFYRQYKTSGPYVPYEDAEVFCGFDAYRTSTSVDHDTDPGHTPYWNGSTELSYLFDTTANTVSVQTITTGNPAIGTVNPDSSTTATQGDPDSDPPDYVSITLSNEVDKAWLDGQLSDWMGESESFRDATGSSISSYGYAGATRSESDGWLGIVGGGDILAIGPTFGGTPSGMVGDEGTTWNGNFSTWVHKVQRKNAPVLHAESYKSDGTVFGGARNLAAGKSIYRAGYAEIELTELIGDVWADGYGAFTQAEALDSFPMSPTHSYSLNELLSYAGSGKANELTLVSRDGRHYRVTLQTGYYVMGDPDTPAVWTTSNTYTLITDENTLQATATLAAETDLVVGDVRVFQIEREDDVGWSILANADDFAQYQADLNDWQDEWDAWDAGGRVGDEPAKPAEVPDPSTMIGPDVVGNYLLLAATKTRSGARFGFTPLSGSSSSRYRKRTFKLHLTPGTVNGKDGSCGLSTFTGAADLEWNEEYDSSTGVQLPRSVTQWQLLINGQDWTQESYESFDAVSFYGSSATVETETKIRHEASFTWSGRFLIAFDEPDPLGKVSSSTWAQYSLTMVSGQNQTSAAGLDLSASGESLFFEGHRLTYP